MTVSAVALLPCPFCGETDLVADFHRLHGSIECKNCGCTVPLPEKSPEIQALRWNRRAAPMEAVSRAYCQKCGGEIQGWTCQGCGQVFRENDAGALVFDAMEAVAWREKVARLIEPDGWREFDDEVRDCKFWGEDLNPPPKADRFGKTASSLRKAAAILEAINAATR